MKAELSTSRPPPIRRSVIVKLQEHMRYSYGKKFTDQWDATKPELWVSFWCEQLAGLTDAEIARGVAALSGRDWPPTLPEFKRLCRPPLDQQAAFYEALSGILARERGERFEWSHPAIYWAAVKVGAFDIKGSGYGQIQKRWETALQALLDAGSYEPIPNPALALPAPGKAALSRSEAVRRLAELKLKLKTMPRG